MDIRFRDVTPDFQEGDGEDQPFSDDNEYPDPESLSTRPWWRNLYLSSGLSCRDGNGAPPSVNKDLDIQNRPVLDSDLLDSRPFATITSSPKGIAERFPSPTMACKYGDEIDPEFELSSGDTTDESMSGLSQVSSDGYHPGSQALMAKKRGRPHRRNRGLKGKRSDQGATRRSQKGIKRGPRRPIEPSDGFKALHTSATAAFIDADYESAEQLILQAILLNPEMYAAHSLLSEIHSARGDHNKALTALFNGAHTRPRDIGAWKTLAQMLLARTDEDQSALADALYCYSRIIQVDSQNVHARHQRAALNRRLGYIGRAATEFEYLLKILPHDLIILRSLAEIYTEMGDPRRATEHYHTSITFYQNQEPTKARTIAWSDINIYAELYADQQLYTEAIFEIKSLSRWLLGRHGDRVWENFHGDDREWDLNDDPRRVEVPGFQAGAYAKASYGEGMPLELHVKLGTYRLKSDIRHVEEAMRQFELLNPTDSSPEARLFKYPDVFREAANALRGAGFYQEALRYYEPLLRVSDFADISYYVDMAFCYKAVGLIPEAEACDRSIMLLEQERTTTQLPLMADDIEVAVTGGTAKNMMDHVAKADQKWQNNEGTPSDRSDRTGLPKSIAPSAMLMPRPSKPFSKRRDVERRLQAQLHEERMRALYGRTQKLLDRARNHDGEALLQWMTAAQELVADFRSHRAFYPCDRSLKTHGQSRSSVTESLKHQVDQTMQDIVGLFGAPTSEVAHAHPLRSLDELIKCLDALGTDPAVIAGDFRGIPFPAWLDLLLEYAILLSHSKAFHKAYEILNVAKDANVFYSSSDSMFLIHVCWFTCALIVDDEETSCSVARWFMKEYHFTTDGYRLFCVLNRLCGGRNTWFNCGPSQKFVRRQLKAMDCLLVDQSQHPSLFQEKTFFTTKDDDDKPVNAGDMDLALLMLYGYMLYLGRSFALSLNYFFRAFALDPRNPIINLSLALAYIQHAIKRQSVNRHILITQGLTFLFGYYDQRHSSHTRSEQQEAEFNVARTYHMLGLTHLAIPYYERCINLSNGSQEVEASGWDEFSAEAALALRNIWAANEEIGKAADVTQRCLVI
ncbi:MAG: hypothetical protein Q9170_000466 [Blastenia crenularia]